MSIKVSLDTTADPPVTVNPTVENVNQGNQTITWVPAQGQPAFTFVGVAFLSTTSPFSAPSFQGGSQMSVTESNNNSGTDYPYVIMVNLNGTDYCSVPSSGAGGSPGGTPVIHNN